MALSAGIDIVAGEKIFENSDIVGSGAVIYKGAALNYNSSGYLVAATNSDSDNGFAGWADAAYDNSDNSTSTGPLLAHYIPFVLEMKKTYSAGDNGKNAYISADDTATTTAGNGIYIGRFCGQGTKGSAYTKINPLLPAIA